MLRNLLRKASISELSPSKLLVSFVPPVDRRAPRPSGRASVVSSSPEVCSSTCSPRRYTLTHNDFTGELFLTVAEVFNQHQVEGWYSKLLRDEVLAEWRGEELCIDLFVEAPCQWWLAPATIRTWIFRRDLPLVLSALRYADSLLLATQPAFLDYPVHVFFHYKNCTVQEYWGSLREVRPPEKSKR
mmetsp:Transcript_26521/g.90681  ORF Transcript_26521/g.90681 Transcript_26521/m.90681 type:complete len:186 (+) Transcript_26521:94-651(+)